MNSCRFTAAADLAMKLEGHPQKKAILEALERQRLKGFESFADHFLNELFITGVHMHAPYMMIMTDKLWHHCLEHSLQDTMHKLSA
jgi:hypothetical protein